MITLSNIIDSLLFGQNINCFFLKIFDADQKGMIKINRLLTAEVMNVRYWYKHISNSLSASPADEIPLPSPCESDQTVLSSGMLRPPLM
jgi:hypothetical protein